MAKPASTATRRDIAQEVTNRILADLENGVASWVKPWSAMPGSGIPSNFLTGRSYSGMNIFILWAAQEAARYPTAQWLTVKQAAELGGQIRAGETGTIITYYGGAMKTDENGEDKAIRFLKSFHVFNVAQFDGLRWDEVVPRAPRHAEERDEWADFFIEETGAEIFEGAGEAFYVPSRDSISMPAFAAFKSAGHFYATSFHELTHWTGAAHRLNRQIKNRFGDDHYALEELVAELSAAFLCAEFGFDGDLRHADYIKRWHSVLKNDKTAFMRAASAASKAHNYLRDLVLADGVGATPEASTAMEQPMAMAA